jgi:hypothetical protein
MIFIQFDLFLACGQICILLRDGVELFCYHLWSAYLVIGFCFAITKFKKLTNQLLTKR